MQRPAYKEIPLLELFLQRHGFCREWKFAAENQVCHSASSVEDSKAAGNGTCCSNFSHTMLRTGGLQSLLAETN